MEIEGVRRALRLLKTPEGGFEDVLAKLDRVERGKPKVQAKLARKPVRRKRRPKAA